MPGVLSRNSGYSRRTSCPISPSYPVSFGNEQSRTGLGKAGGGSAQRLTAALPFSPQLRLREGPSVALPDRQSRTDRHTARMTFVVHIAAATSGRFNYPA